VLPHLIAQSQNCLLSPNFKITFKKKDYRKNVIETLEKAWVKAVCPPPGNTRE